MRSEPATEALARLRAGLGLAAVSVLVGILVAGLVAAAVLVLGMALRRAVG